VIFILIGSTQTTEETKTDSSARIPNASKER